MVVLHPRGWNRLGHGFDGLCGEIYFLLSIVIVLCVDRHPMSQRGYDAETTSPAFEQSFLWFHSLSLKVLSWHRLFLSFITGLLLFCALIILVAGIIFDFHKSWSVGFARLLCWAGTMAIPQPPALPSITQFLQIMTLPIICVCVRVPLIDSWGNHIWITTEESDDRQK